MAPVLPYQWIYSDCCTCSNYDIRNCGYVVFCAIFCWWLRCKAVRVILTSLERCVHQATLYHKEVKLISSLAVLLYHCSVHITTKHKLTLEYRAQVCIFAISILNVYFNRWFIVAMFVNRIQKRIL